MKIETFYKLFRSTLYNDDLSLSGKINVLVKLEVERWRESKNKLFTLSDNETIDVYDSLININSTKDS